MHSFESLLEGLRARLQAMVRNGDLTERGLARRMGLSQPHMHNILKGTRHLKPDLADRVLREMGISLAELLQEDKSAPRRPAGSQRLDARTKAAASR
jgi:transcriptional regulator with XRE-family HTH domain